MKKYTSCEIITNNKIADNIYDMIIKNEHIASCAVSGQFINIYLTDKDLILPRPISICDIDYENSYVRIVYKIVGKGTKSLSCLSSGSKINALGPIGNGFPIFSEKNNITVVGGGIGTPPLIMLVKSILKQNNKSNISVILGFQSEPILINEFKLAGVKTYIATNDGNVGFHGNAIDYLNKLKLTYDVIYACGSKAMLKNISEFSKKEGTPCYIALEERMACGVGACLGCVTKIEKNNKISYERLCIDGPVFNANYVKFGENT